MQPELIYNTISESTINSSFFSILFLCQNDFFDNFAKQRIFFLNIFISVCFRFARSEIVQTHQDFMVDTTLNEIGTVHDVCLNV